MSTQSAKMGGPLVPDQTYLIHQSAECFATCSADLSAERQREYCMRITCLVKSCVIRIWGFQSRMAA